jgi:GNAT superfamily N-acetyltransferase
MTDRDIGSVGTPFPAEVKLRDGTPVLIRQIKPQDKHLLEIGFSHLSKEAQYFRFFRPMSKLSKKLLDQFTDIDHVSHEAIGALGTGEDANVPYGIARYICTPQKPETAEVAVTVIDAQQGKGLGTLLLAFLACRAVRNDITEFVAFVMGGNHQMLEVFKELGSTSEIGVAGEIEVTIPLFADADSYPNTPAGDVIRNISALFEAAS